MRVLREDRMRRGAVLSDTVGKNSLFVKGIFEKYGQGEKYVFDPVSFVYLLPSAAPSKEEAPAKRDEERAREYVLREKETVRLMTNSLRSREFIVRLTERAVMPSSQELLCQKARKVQLICQVQKLLQECKEFERELSQMPDEPKIQSAAPSPDGEKEKSLNREPSPDGEKENGLNREPSFDVDEPKIFRIDQNMEAVEREPSTIRRFHEEIEGLEKNLALWQEAGASRNDFYQGETVQSVKRLLRERRILEQRIEYRLFDRVRRLCAERIQEESKSFSHKGEQPAEHTDAEERENLLERLTQVWPLLTDAEEIGEGSYPKRPEWRSLKSKLSEEPVKLPEEILRGEPELRRAYLLSLILRESNGSIADIETLTERLRENREDIGSEPEAEPGTAYSLKESDVGQTLELLWQTASQLRPEELEQAVERLEKGQALTYLRQSDPKVSEPLEELRAKIQKRRPTEYQGEISEASRGEHPENRKRKAVEQIQKDEISRFLRTRQEEILRIEEKEILRGRPELRRAYLLSLILRESDDGIADIETLTERLWENIGSEPEAEPGTAYSPKEADAGQTLELLWQTASQLRPKELHPEELRAKIQEGRKISLILQETDPKKKRRIQWFSRLLKETGPSELVERLTVREVRQLSREIEWLEKLVRQESFGVSYGEGSAEKLRDEELTQEFPKRLLEVQRRLADGMSLEEIDRAEAALKEQYPAKAEQERSAQEVLLRIRSERLRRYVEQDFRRLLQVKSSGGKRHRKFPEGFWAEVSESIGITTLIGRLNPQESSRLETWMRKWKGSPGEIVWVERLLAGKLSPAERAAVQRQSAEYRTAVERVYERGKGSIKGSVKDSVKGSVKDLQPEKLLQDFEIARVLQHVSGLTASEDIAEPERNGPVLETAEPDLELRFLPRENGEPELLHEEAANRMFQAEAPKADEGGYAAADREPLFKDESGAQGERESGAGELQTLRSLIVRQDPGKQEQTRQQERQESQRRLLMQLQNQNRQQENAIRVMEKRQEELQTQLQEPKQTWEELEKRVLERLQGQLRMERMRRGLL